MVAGIVDVVDVVAEEASHDIGAGFAVDGIGAIVAHQLVGDFVADQVDRVGGGLVVHPQDFHRLTRRQRVAHGRAHSVGALVGDLEDLVGGLVDDIDVVSAEPSHGVDAASAVEGIGAVVADEGVVDLVAGTG